MSNEFDFKKYKTMEEYAETIEGTNYLHDLYLKAVNNPVRREMLNIINEGKISKEDLLSKLLENKTLDDDSMFKYHIDYLKNAFCIKILEEDDKTYYEITQSGEVVDKL